PQAVLELSDEGTGVPERRVLHRVLAQDQHGELGQVVTGEDVQRAALELLPHRREAVAVEAGAVADPEGLGHAVASRPGPDGPANACAMSSQCPASAPTATSAVSARCVRWVASRQKSYADPLTRCAAS